MKTVEERAIDIWKTVSWHEEIAIKQIIKALKEQDKITRHACAENIHNLEKIPSKTLKKSLVVLDEVHQIIMNTKAI